MKSKILSAALCLSAATFIPVLKVSGQVGPSRVVTVTTTNNVSPPAGTVSLFQALTSLQDGDLIQFNIPGEGPHFIETPPGGYPIITNNSVTIDGYSQPGSVPNTNPILSSNNAQIKIVLDSRNGNSRLMDFPPASPNDLTGYGDDNPESAVLGILEVTNITVSGLSIIAVPLTGPEVDTTVYAVSFAKGASGHVKGCWIGIAPDGTTLAGPARGVTGYRYRVRDESETVLQDILIQNVTVGVAKGSTNARSEFNVFTGIPSIPVHIEGSNLRISGNFLNVWPGGLVDYNPPRDFPNLPDEAFGGNIEIGRGDNNIVIGIDGDGVNDADERNVFSGVLTPALNGYDHNIEFYGQTPGTNIVIAGNYIGVGVDGTTYFTNGVPAVNAGGGSAQYRIGSDFDGVSDDLEGNLIVNNFPASVFPPSEFATAPGNLNFFDELSTGGIVSLRGNSLINNFPAPVSPLKSDGQFLLDYMGKALLDTNNGIVPILSSNSSTARLIGTVPVAGSNYATTVIDVYLADLVGITNGQAAGIPELTNGFVQGRVYLGSFIEGSAADLNTNAGAFEFETSGLGLASTTNLTITANYLQGAASVHNGVALTSSFSDPVLAAFEAGTPQTTITAVTLNGPALTLSWSGGGAPYLVQRKASLSDATWMDLLTTSNTTANVALDGSAGFFHIVSNATNTVIPFTVWMSGEAERPTPVTTTASGFGSLSLNGTTLNYSISYSGLSGPAIAAHIHGPTNSTAAANVLIPFTGVTGTSGIIAGSTTLSAEQVTALRSGLLYVNIHTGDNQGGEIRGQIASVRFAATLNGANERPSPVETIATGTGSFELIGNSLLYNVSWSGLSGPATAGHIHGPAPTNDIADVLVPFPDVAGVSGSVTGSAILTQDALGALVDGLTYANIHTGANVGGEIRGQLVPE